jgi:hypothetical protein
MILNLFVHGCLSIIVPMEIKCKNGRYSDTDVQLEHFNATMNLSNMVNFDKTTSHSMVNLLKNTIKFIVLMAC